MFVFTLPHSTPLSMSSKPLPHSTSSSHPTSNTPILSSRQPADIKNLCSLGAFNYCHHSDSRKHRCHYSIIFSFICHVQKNKCWEVKTDAAIKNTMILSMKSPPKENKMEDLWTGMQHKDPWCFEGVPTFSTHPRVWVCCNSETEYQYWGKRMWGRGHIEWMAFPEINWIWLGNKEKWGGSENRMMSPPRFMATWNISNDVISCPDTCSLDIFTLLTWTVLVSNLMYRVTIFT